MDNSQLFLQKVIRYVDNLRKRFLGSSIVMEYTYIQKCLLLLGFQVVIFGTFIFYEAVVLLNPAWRSFINPSLFEQMLWVDIVVVLIAILMMFSCYRFRQSEWANRNAHYFCVFFYAITLCSMGYEVGAMSPTTGIFIIGTPIIGLALFPRRMVLMTTFIAAITMISMAYAGVVGWIPYAPMFVDGGILDFKHHSTFYFYSQMFFMLPPSLIIMITSDVILKQWHKRGNEVALLSQLDSLTGLYNRRTINEHMERLVDNHEGHDRVAILLLDLDFFKAINDTYGHMIGDEVLRTVGQSLQHSMRKHDAAGRFGGEEFIVILSGADREIGMAVAERIRANVEAIRITAGGGEKIHVTTSIGVATCKPTDMARMHTLVMNADQALYQAKHSGRNRVVHFVQIPADKLSDVGMSDTPQAPQGALSDQFQARGGCEVLPVQL